MANSIPLTFRAAPLPERYKADPEQFKNDIVARLYAESGESIAFFASGSVAPSSNVGPWLKNGQEWWVWSDDVGGYIPMLVPQETLKYAVQSAEPDPTKYLFWIQLDGLGSPLALKTYYGAAWVDVYAFALSGYMTTAAFNAAIANYSTTAQMNTAISSAITAALTAYSTTAQMNTAISAAITAALAPYSTTAQMNTAISTALSSYTNTTGMNSAIAAGDSATLSSANSYTNSQISAITSYPGQGYRTTTPQSISANDVPTKCTFEGASINPSPAPVNVGLSRYVAPANGIYEVSISTQIDNNTADAATLVAELDIYKNGSSTGIGDLDSTPSPNDSQWTPAITTLVSMNTNDYIEAYLTINDTPGTGAVNVSKLFLSVHRVSS